MTIPGGAPALFFTAAAAGPAAGYAIDRSLRFNSADSAYLSRTPSSAGNRKKWTWSGWVKLTKDASNTIFAAGDSSDFHAFYHRSDGTFKWDDVIGGSDVQLNKITDAVFRDYSAFYHIVLSVDTTLSTAADRNRMYVNGQQLTFASGNDFAQNDDAQISGGSSNPFLLGQGQGGFLSAYLADVQFVDGQALAPTDFGETDSNGVWQPKEYSPTISAPNEADKVWSTDLSASSGFQSSYPARNAFDGLFTSNNDVGRAAANNAGSTLTFAPTGGITVTDKIEVYTRDGTITVNGGSSYTSSSSLAFKDISSVSPSTPFTLTSLAVTGTPGNNAGEIYAIKIDGVVLQDKPKYGYNGFHLKFADNSSDAALGFDSSSDSNTVVNSQNFATVTYSGNGGTQSISSLAFKPDFIWFKSRNTNAFHTLVDSVRGGGNFLRSNEANAETTGQADLVTSFNSNGFTMGANANSGDINQSGRTYVAWCWKAGGAASSNTDGSITSQVSVNQAKGFSIVTWTGTGSAGSIGHGLGSTPKLVFVKNRSSNSGQWRVYSSALGNQKALFLSNSDAEDTSAAFWNNTSPNDTTFTVGTDNNNNKSGESILAYAWSEVPSFSKFGSYTGGTNNNTITLGFKPRFLLIKVTNTSDSWLIYDSERHPGNPVDDFLQANSSEAEATGNANAINFLDNGFQLASTQGGTNGSGNTYIYMAFADDVGNHFDANNLTASTGDKTPSENFTTVTYTGNGAAQRHIGGEVYSSTSSVTVNNSNSNQSGSLAGVFNGNQTANSSNAYGFTTGAMDFTWTPATAISYNSKVRVWTGFSGGSVYLNGGSAVSTANNNWTTVVDGSSGSITSIRFTVGSGGGWWAGIEVDDVVLLDGDGSTISFSPDLVWVKERTNSGGDFSHRLHSSVIGASVSLSSNSTAAERDSSAQAGGGVESFNSDGFTAKQGTSNNNNQNNNNSSYVGWLWNAGANSNKTYTVKVVSDSGNKYRFDDYGTSAVTLELAEGSTYVFDQSDSSNSGHPLRFSTTSDGTHGGGSEYTTGVTVTGTPGSAGAKTTIVVAASAPNLAYYCTQHSGMGGNANTNSTAGASNFDGGIQSVVKANQAKGIAIGKFTGTGSINTVGTGLSNTRIMIMKNKDSASNWVVYHTIVDGSYDYMYLNLTNANASSGLAPFAMNNAFKVGSNTDTNASGDEYSFFAFSPVAGFSSLGSYTGNGSSTGPTITTGFKPAFVLAKRASGTGRWVMYDNKRSNVFLEANSSAADSGSNFEFLDNGFQLKDGGTMINGSGETYIYMAFADNLSGEGCDSLVDSPEQRADQTDDGVGGNVVGNYAVLNSLDGTLTLSNGNLQSDRATSSWASNRSTIAVSSGKWYFEFSPTAGSGTHYMQAGVYKLSGSALNSDPSSQADGYIYNAANGNKYNNNSSAGYGDSWAVGDTIGVALDLDGGNLFFYKNGTIQNSGTAAYTGLSGTFAAVVAQYGTCTIHSNFGQRPFVYTAPSGYKCLNTANLPTPTIADGSKYFGCKTYTSDGQASKKISFNFGVDFFWSKVRNFTENHVLHDSVRGADKALLLPNASAEVTRSTGVGVLSFDSDGVTLGTGSPYNSSGTNAVVWAWDAGSSTVTNTDGSVSSQVRAEPSAGFSICTYTGNGTGGASIGHGLNDAPSVVLVKRRNSSAYWEMFHASVGNTKTLYLNVADAATTSSASWNNTSPTSSVFTLGNSSGTNASGSTYVAYCFAPVAGYSAMGAYPGSSTNGGSGPFVYCGFRPAFILVKKYDGGDGGVMWDTARAPFNAALSQIRTHESSAESGEYSAFAFDILSNGFRPVGPSGQVNEHGKNFVFIAFAENPFSLARAR